MRVCGIWLTVSVTSSAPPVSARMKPLPWWIGTRPRRSGSANVVWPSPPYVVPMSVKSVSFSEIGQELALAEHPARGREVAGEHPDLTDEGLCHGSGSSDQVGLGKMPLRAMQKFRVRNGCMFRCAWLPPTFVTLVGASAVRLRRRGRRAGSAVGQQVPPVRSGCRRWPTSHATRACASGSSAIVERVCLFAAALAERVARAHVDRHPAAQVGQCEVRPGRRRRRWCPAARRAPGSG